MNPGFSLFELMIVLIILSILITVGYPAYVSSIRKTHRLEAITDLLNIQLAEERYHAYHKKYGSLTQIPFKKPISQHPLYQLVITNLSQTQYTVLANAIGGQKHDQQHGISCAILKIMVANGNERKAPTECWL